MVLENGWSFSVNVLLLDVIDGLQYTANISYLQIFDLDFVDALTA